MFWELRVNDKKFEFEKKKDSQLAVTNAKYINISNLGLLNLFEVKNISNYYPIGINILE